MEGVVLKYKRKGGEYIKNLKRNMESHIVMERGGRPKGHGKGEVEWERWKIAGVEREGRLCHGV